MKYPMQNHRGWSGYFEDVYRFNKPVNYNQYSPMETARYVMQHPEVDPEWRKARARIDQLGGKNFHLRGRQKRTRRCSGERMQCPNRLRT